MQALNGGEVIQSSVDDIESDREIESEGETDSEAVHSPRLNHVLISLPESELAVIEPYLEYVEIESKDVIAQAGQRLEWVHFPETSVISLVTLVNGEGGIEGLTVGKEGMTGIPVLSGCRTTFGTVVGQIPGRGFRISSDDFAALLPKLPALQKQCYMYAQLAFDVTSQSAACNRLHVTEERCARWLLMSQDRAGRDEFELTQEFLSQMLGVRRPAVTVAIGILERAGLIAHRRGRIRITDREGLEEAACECYSLIRRRQKELQGF